MEILQYCEPCVTVRLQIHLFITFVVFTTVTNGQCQDVLDISLTDSQRINITTPNYPERYANNLDCTWHISYPEGLGITVRFFDFDTELNYDKLQLSPYEGGNSLVYQGNSVINALYIRWNQLWVWFTSDSSGQRKGFNMQITVSDGAVCLDDEFSCAYQRSYITCVDAASRCDTVQICDDGADERGCGFCFDNGVNLTSTEPLIITTPGYPREYPLDSECSYHVKAPPEYHVVLTLLDFNIEWIYDLLYIQPSAEADYDASLVLHGVRVPDVVFTDSDEVWLRFESDSYTVYSGFKIELSVVENTVRQVCGRNQWPCDQIYRTCFNRQYLCDGYQECFSSADDEGNCYDDHNAVTLTEGNATTISSPAFPVFYPANIDITWQTIAGKPSQSHIRLVFVNFSLAVDKDFIFIQRNESAVLAGSLMNLTGSSGLGLELVSEMSEMWLRFIAGDFPVQIGMGFAAVLSVAEMADCPENKFECNNRGLITCLEQTMECDFQRQCLDGADEGPQCGFCWNPVFNIGSVTTSLTSPFYPNPYPPNLQCLTRIVAPNIYGIKIRLLDFVLSDLDRLSLRNSNITSEISVASNDEAFNIHELVSSIISRRSELWLSFVVTSSNPTDGNGFSIEVSRFRIGDELEGMCETGDFPCASNLPAAMLCLKQNAICNGVQECSDQQDERGCGFVTTTMASTTFQRSTTSLQTTSTMMSTPATTMLTMFTATSATTPTMSATAMSTTTTTLTSTMSTEPVTVSTTDYVVTLPVTVPVSTTDYVVTLPVTVPASSTDSFVTRTTSKPDVIDICTRDSMIIEAPPARGLLSLSSPGYPTMTYPNDKTCRWIISASDEARIAIGFIDIFMEIGYDFLVITDTTTSGIIVALTGDSKLTQITSDYNQVMVEFITDKTGVDRGFNIEVWQFTSTAPQCIGNDIHCLNGYCVDSSAGCNGMDDCMDGTDEQQCGLIECIDTFQCNNGNTCLALDKLCDGESTCMTGEDEELCDVIKCPDDCTCGYHDNEIYIQCLRGWLRSMSGVSDIPTITEELEIRAEHAFLHPGTFKSLSRLEKLTVVIGSTAVPDIPTRTFDRQQQLTWLNITNLNFGLLNDTFRELASLRVLLLWNSLYIELESGAFNGMDSLHTLAITRANPLIDINASSLSAQHVTSLPKLRTIFVDDARLCCDIPQSISCIALQSTYSISECSSLLGSNTFRILALLLGTCAVVGNMAVIVMFLINRNTHVGKVHYLLVTHLAVSDLLMGIYLIIIAIQDIMYDQSYQTLSRDWQSSLMCRTAGFLAFLSSQASLGFLLMVCVDRFTALFRPFEIFKLNVYSTTVSTAFTWFLTGLFGITFAALAGPADNDKFGQSDVCFSLPYLIKPSAYTVDVGGESAKSNTLYLLAISPKTAAWKFLSSMFYGLDLICVLLVISLVIGIAIFGMKSYRNYQNMEQIKLSIRVAPVFLLKLVTWSMIIAVGIWSMSATNVVTENTYSWFILFVFPLSACLGPVLYMLLVCFTLLEAKDDADEPIVDNFTSEQNMVTEIRDEHSIEEDIELKGQPEVMSGTEHVPRSTGDARLGVEGACMHPNATHAEQNFTNSEKTHSDHAFTEQGDEYINDCANAKLELPPVDYDDNPKDILKHHVEFDTHTSANPADIDANAKLVGGAVHMGLGSGKAYYNAVHADQDEAYPERAEMGLAPASDMHDVHYAPSPGAFTNIS